MSIRRVMVLVACTVVIGLLGGTAWAGQSMLRVEVGFDFMVQERALPAGTYQIVVEGPTGSMVTLRNSETGDVIRLPIQTRLANLGTKKISLVFDRTTDKHYLSEIHIPRQDGYLLKGAPGEHEHELLPAK